MPRSQENHRLSFKLIPWGLLLVGLAALGGLVIGNPSSVPIISSPLFSTSSSSTPSFPEGPPVLKRNQYRESLERVKRSLPEERKEALDSSLSKITTHFMLTSSEEELEAVQEEMHYGLDGMTAGDVISFADSLEKTGTFGKRPADPVEIVDWTWEVDPTHGLEGAVTFDVKVKNNSLRYLPQARVEFEAFDANGNLITSTFTYVDSLYPGRTTSTASYATYDGTVEKAQIRVVPPSY